MNVITIDTTTSFGAVGMLRTLAEANVRFNVARLNVKNVPTESNDSKDWALIFECSSEQQFNREFEVRIHMLTCGCSGTGPIDLLECLEITGFRDYISEDRIFTQNRIVDVFYKY